MEELSCPEDHAMKKVAWLMASLVIMFSSLVYAHANIGVFDLNRALFETVAWQERLRALETELQEDTDAASTLTQELQELQQQIATNAPVLSASELRRLQEEGQVKQLRLQQIGERVQSVLRDSQNDFIDQYRDLVGTAITEVYEEGEYDLILKADSIVVSGFTFDVTSEVTAKLNNLITDLNQSGQ